MNQLPSLCSSDLMRSRLLRVKTRKAQTEHMFSALPPIADIANYHHSFSNLPDAVRLYLQCITSPERLPIPIHKLKRNSTVMAINNSGSFDYVLSREVRRTSHREIASHPCTCGVGAIHVEQYFSVKLRVPPQDCPPRLPK